MSYQIYSDATADACPSMLEGLPAAEIIPMEVMVGDRSYTYGPGGDLTVEQFYAEQRAGKFATTSQINPLVYRKAFEKALKMGRTYSTCAFPPAFPAPSSARGCACGSWPRSTPSASWCVWIRCALPWAKAFCSVRR